MGAILALVWMGVLYNLSEMDGPVLPPGPNWYSFAHNLAHAPAFGLLAFWTLILLPRREAGPDPIPWPDLTPARLRATIGFVVLYGLADEFHQSFVPGRSPSLFDVVSDGVGAICVVWVVLCLGRAEAREGDIWRRLIIGLCACGLAAGASTLWTLSHEDGPWPF
jgi:hypothetical protein